MNIVEDEILNHRILSVTKDTGIYGTVRILSKMDPNELMVIAIENTRKRRCGKHGAILTGTKV